MVRPNGDNACADAGLPALRDAEEAVDAFVLQIDAEDGRSSRRDPQRRRPRRTSVRGLSMRFSALNAISPGSSSSGVARQAAALIVTWTCDETGVLSVPEEAKPAMSRTAAAASAKVLTNMVLELGADVHPRKLVQDRFLGRGDEPGAVQDRRRAEHRVLVGRVGDGHHREAPREADR